MDDIQHQTGGGGWISGPSTTIPHRDLPDVDPPPADEPQDVRPAYNPDLIVRGVIALLSDEGIDLELTGGQRRLAALQATKLLTTLGVKAVT